MHIGKIVFAQLMTFIKALSSKDELTAISNNSRKTAFERNYLLKVAQTTLDVYRKVINANN